MHVPPVGLGFVLLLILAAEFVNGFTDAPNAIATVVSTRVLSPMRAVLMASILSWAPWSRWCWERKLPELSAKGSWTRLW